MTEDHLVAAIRADPDSDAPRMVYADWLQQRGEVMGEWIAVLLRGDDGVARAATAHWRALFDQDVRIERGMPAALTLYAAQLVPALVDNLRGTMIRDLDLRDGNLSDANVDVLERAAARMAVRTLRFGMWCKDGEHARMWPWFADVAALELPRGLGDDAGRALAAAPWRHLARLHIDGPHGYAGRAGQFGDAAAVALTRAPALARGLRALAVTSLNIGARGAAALVDGTLPLASLDLTGNPIHDAGVVEMLRGPGVARLHTLSLVGVGVRDGAAAALAQTPALANLRRLVLADHRDASWIKAPGIAALIASPYLSRDLELVLDGEALGMDIDEDVAFYGQISRRWVGEPDPALAARFRVKVSEIY